MAKTPWTLAFSGFVASVALMVPGITGAEPLQLSAPTACRSAPQPDSSAVRTLAAGEQVMLGRHQGGGVQVTTGSPACWITVAAGAPQASPAHHRAARTHSQPHTAAHLRGRASRSHYAALRLSRQHRTRGRARSSGATYGGSCPCSGSRICIGPRGGRYCITSGGNKRYGV